MPDWAVPGYTEVKPLGSGGFGAVLLATHDETGTPVAIKYLRSDLLDDPDFIAMFRSEAAVLASLDDPYVVRLFEYVESPSGAAIVMELVDGVTLREILLRQGKTTPESALVVLFGSLLGLAAAHARGVVHRDFKPANVLVNARGVSKLTDFGIAARAGTPGIAAASRNYAPPEQYDGAPASPASDVYAATATFYECLTGRPPFAGPTDEALLDQHRFADVPLDEVPEALQPLVARGMAKDPRYRPADSAALAAELRATATGAYGQGWAERGRSHLGEAALLLAALWPSAGVPSLQGTTAEQARLTHATQHAARPAHHPSLSQAERATRHRWHVRHLEHLRHLRAVAAATAAAAVVAAGVTVAVTGRSGPPAAPGASGTSGHPVVAAYPVSFATIPITTASSVTPVNGDVYVVYQGGSHSSAQVKGQIKDAAAGEIVRLYAQPFPYTRPPAPTGSLTLNPTSGSADYAFQVAPTLATRYQAELFGSATAVTPLAGSAITTIYVVAGTSSNSTNCAGHPVCHATYTVTLFVSPSALREELTKQWYPYFAVTLGPPGSTPAAPTSVQLDAGNPVVGKSQRTSANSLTFTVTFTYSIGNEAGTFRWNVCDKDTEPADGIGLPNAHGCGAPSLSVPSGYIG